MKFFAKPNLPHHQFNIAASNALVSYKTESFLQTRQLDTSRDAVLHELERIGDSLDCCFCQHGYKKPRGGRHTTTFKCKSCKIPIFRPSKSQCWDLHIIDGVPKKIYNKKKKKKKLAIYTFDSQLAFIKETLIVFILCYRSY